MTSLLESVVQVGTGRRAKVLNRPVAAKTGTTNNLHDAWFVGYTPGVTTGAWVGFDELASLGEGETGGRAASPIWIEFMGEILKDQPVKIFKVPEGVVFSRMNQGSGNDAAPGSQNHQFECYKEGSTPVDPQQKKETVSESADLFKLEM